MSPKRHTADVFRPHLRDGFPWHRPDVAHPELCEPEAWWAAVRPQLARAYEAAGYDHGRALELADAARRLYVDPGVGWSLFDDTLPVLERLTQAGWTHAILYLVLAAGIVCVSPKARAGVRDLFPRPRRRRP